MNYLLYTFLLLTVSLSSVAQIFSEATNDTTYYGSSTDTDFYGNIPIANIIATNTAMYWEVDSLNLPPNWQFSVCDQSFCNAIGVSSDNWSLPVSGGYLNMHFYPNNTEGEGLVRLKVQDMPNSSQITYLNFRGVATSLSTENLNRSVLKIYPNPFKNLVSVDGTHSGESFEVYNLLGELEVKGWFTDTNNKIDLSEFQKGIYFLKLGESEVVRLIKN